MEKELENRVEENQQPETVEQETLTEKEKNLLVEKEKMEKDYKSLLRAYTKGQQKLKELNPDLEYLNYIKANPELLVQVDEVVRGFKGGTYITPQASVNTADIKEAISYLYKQPDYDKYRDEIEAFAESEGLDSDNPVELKKAFLLWRGANVDKLIKDKMDKEQNKISKKQTNISTAPPIQGSGSIHTPPQDYTKMSEEEWLKSAKARGIKIFEED